MATDSAGFWLVAFGVAVLFPIMTERRYSSAFGRRYLGAPQPWWWGLPRLVGAGVTPFVMGTMWFWLHWLASTQHVLAIWPQWSFGVVCMAVMSVGVALGSRRLMALLGEEVNDDD